MVKLAVNEYLTKSQDSQSTLQHVREVLQELHERECLIVEPAIYMWALQLASQVVVQPPVMESPVSSSHDSNGFGVPLFCKDTVYHASICSHAVNQSDAGDYLKFFKTKYPGHSFQAVSISRSKQDRYLIARQGDSTYYFAFQSEPLVKEIHIIQ